MDVYIYIYIYICVCVELFYKDIYSILIIYFLLTHVSRFLQSRFSKDSEESETSVRTRKEKINYTSHCGPIPFKIFTFISL